MWSARERVIREQHLHTNDCPDVKLNLKESLFSLFIQNAGVQGRQANVFGLNNTNGGGIDTVLVAQVLRLDIANHTVVLDTIMLTRGALPSNLAKNIATINVNTDELEAWKHMLSVYVERCRSWSHKPVCEYKKRNRTPLSTKHGERPICSCGIGKVDRNAVRDLPGWDVVQGHAVRAAISPLYGLPFVEKLVDEKMMSQETAHAPAATPSGTDKCARCDKKQAAGGGALLKCGGCRSVAYCSKECQRESWKAHKNVCKRA